MKNFKPSRFALLLKKQWQDVGKLYLISFLILFGGLLLTYFVVTSMNYISGRPFNDLDMLRFSSMRFRANTMGIFGMLYISLLSSQYYLKYKEASTRIQELTLPVSKLENIICAILYAVLVPLLSYAIIFTICDSLCVVFLRNAFAEYDLDQIIIGYNNFWFTDSYGFKYFINTLSVTDVTVLVASGTIVGSACLLGSIYFKRYAFLKTIVALILVGLFVITKGEIVEKLLYLGKVGVMDYSDNQQSHPVLVYSFLVLFILLTVGSIWAATYFRLKEKEV